MLLTLSALRVKFTGLGLPTDLGEVQPVGADVIVPDYILLIRPDFEATRRLCQELLVTAALLGVVRAAIRREASGVGALCVWRNGRCKFRVAVLLLATDLLEFQSPDRQVILIVRIGKVLSVLRVVVRGSLLYFFLLRRDTSQVIIVFEARLVVQLQLKRSSATW